mgnify:CR=1 FL=1
MTAKWTSRTFEGYPAWVGETEAMALTVVPKLGGKAISLVNKRTNREWLWRSGKPLGNGGYGTPFSAGDESGWDEMFPAINAGTYPDAPWQGTAIPDHGEVWALPWSDRQAGEELRLRVNGVKFPYTLSKTYSFPAEHTLRVDYTLENRSAAAFSFLWAAHPLLRVRAGMKLRVPAGLNEIEVSYSHGERLGAFGDKRPWPIAPASGGPVDLSEAEPESACAAEKYYFTGRLSEGTAELADPATGEALAIAFPVDRVPYLAIWANYGGYGGHYHLAIEPATGRMDELAHAMQANEAATVAPGGCCRWHLDLSVR